MIRDSFQKQDYPRHRRSGLTLLEFLAVVLVIVVIIAFLSLPATRSRTASAGAECRSNLKIIGHALHNYHAEYGSFPPAYTVDADGNRLHSWRTLLLPWLEANPLYDTIDFSKPWDDPVNAAAHSQMPNFFRCPVPELPDGHTVYHGIVSENGFFQPGRVRSNLQIENNLKLAVVEVDASRAVHWMSPHDVGEEFILNLTPETKTNHKDGTNVLRVEGSVVLMPSDTPQAERQIILDVTKTTQPAEEQ